MMNKEEQEEFLELVERFEKEYPGFKERLEKAEKERPGFKSRIVEAERRWPGYGDPTSSYKYENVVIEQSDRDKFIKIYKATYPGDSCGYDMCSGGRMTISSDNLEESVSEPFEEESAEILMDRLKRSLAIGRNLFYEEWENVYFDYDDWDA